jgi:hypothetical protein
VYLGQGLFTEEANKNIVEIIYHRVQSALLKTVYKHLFSFKFQMPKSRHFKGKTG